MISGKRQKILVELMFSFSAIAFNMMKPLSTLSVRAGTTMIKQSYSAR